MMMLLYIAQVQRLGHRLLQYHDSLCDSTGQSFKSLGASCSCVYVSVDFKGEEQKALISLMGGTLVCHWFQLNALCFQNFPLISAWLSTDQSGDTRVKGTRHQALP